MAQVWPLLLVAFAGSLCALTLVAGAGLLLMKPLIALVWRRFTKRLLTDPYDENLWELASVLQTIGVQRMIETGLRAESGNLIKRPFGSVKNFPSLARLLLDFAQVTRAALGPDETVGVATVIGPMAARPLRLSLPIVVGGMAWGFSVSERTALAIAKGCSDAGTCVNTGEGPYLPQLREVASLLVLQWNRGTWAKDEEILKQADAVEIQLGQGARGGVGSTHEGRSLDVAVRSALQLNPDERAVAGARPPELPSMADLPGLVKRIRSATGGAPVGVKLAANKNLERDLATLVNADVDFVTVCGSEGGTWGAPPALEDDFGMPTLYAIARAGRFFRGRGLKGKITLIADGGLYAPGDFLKVIALGADAVSIGTVALFALGHDQVLKALPWEPATQLVYHGGKVASQLDVPKAARNLTNFLLSCRLEMEEGLRALGKADLRELALSDLTALDQETASCTGAAFGGLAPEPRKVRTAKRGPEAAKRRGGPVPIDSWRSDSRPD